MTQTQADYRAAIDLGLESATAEAVYEYTPGLADQEAGEVLTLVNMALMELNPNLRLVSEGSAAIADNVRETFLNFILLNGEDPPTVLSNAFSATVYPNYPLHFNTDLGYQICQNKADLEQAVLTLLSSELIGKVLAQVT